MIDAQRTPNEAPDSVVMALMSRLWSPSAPVKLVTLYFFRIDLVCVASYHPDFYRTAAYPASLPACLNLI